jgi:serine/threonine protein kinase
MQHLQPNTTLQGGKYRIERMLGQGGFGITYLARNTVFDVNVAIKEFFMKDENNRNGSLVTMPNATKSELFLGQKEKFKKEAKRIFAIKNEHIIAVHDLFEENGTAYYVMDYIDGENLNERLKRTSQPINEGDAKNILLQILDALVTIHDAGIWHLDLKPGNIMLDKQGNVYLIDFGASKQIRADGSFTTSTALCYTPGYAPNEQIGQMYDRFGPWTDIYALGATIYNLLTNKQPPMGIDIEEDGEDAFAFPSSVSTEMRSLVLWMMQPKRKARPQSVVEIIKKLKDPSSNIQQEEPIINTSQERRTGVEQPLSEESTIISLKPLHIGEFLQADGSFSENIDEESIGVLYAMDNNKHYKVLSANETNVSKIKGKKLTWRMAYLNDWLEIIENLCNSNVVIGLGLYKRFNENVKTKLERYTITEPSYFTMDPQSGVT